MLSLLTGWPFGFTLPSSFTIAAQVTSGFVPAVRSHQLPLPRLALSPRAWHAWAGYHMPTCAPWILVT